MTPMSNYPATSALESLADYCGIVPAFIDARGQEQTTSHPVRGAVLASMGLQAVDEESARETLTRLQEEDQGGGLPPVYVHDRTHGPLKIVLTGSRASSAAAWRLRLEDGSTRTG